MVEDKIVFEEDYMDLLEEEIVPMDSFEASTSSSNEVWIMEFDSCCVSMGSSEGIVLISLKGEIFPYSCKLQFSNTNNTVEYKALILGLNMAQIKEIKNLHVKGDVELVVCQVKGQHQARNGPLGLIPKHF